MFAFVTNDLANILQEKFSVLLENYRKLAKPIIG